MEKLRTGISGLDEMLNGGIPKKRHIAVFGGPGTGKTSLAFEYLYHGAKEEGQNGLYLTLEESPEDIIENMKNQFSAFTDVDELIKKKKLFFETPENFTVESILEALEEKIVKNDVERAVIDSSTMLKAMFEKESEYRRTMLEMFNLLKKLECTVLVLVEADTSEKEKITFSIEHYILDGIFNIYNLDKGDRRIRALEIFKMRGTDHSRELVPFKVTPNGIKVYTGEKVF
jgi:circadian clock protein KaiC